jgi:D-alanyl-D-alanine carboxypeptidase
VKRKLLVLFGVVVLLTAVVSGCVIYAKHGSTPNHKNSTHKTPPAAQQKSTAQQTGFDTTQFSTTDPASPWVVVNKQHPVTPSTYAPADLTSVGNGQQMRAEAATALQKLFTDAQTAGYTLLADSAYRSYNTQVSTYASIVKSYGQTYADTVSARAGFSEHQTGWAVDIGTGSCHVADCFGDTPGGKWAQDNAYKYGFLLRYPDNLTNITGYSHEAWHFRYVGVVLSTELHQQNVNTLEQFFGVTGGTTYISTL